jgi:hypothetical protein
MMESLTQNVNMISRPLGRAVRLFQFTPEREADSTGLRDLEEAALAREIAQIKLMRLLKTDKIKQF